MDDDRRLLLEHFRRLYASQAGNAPFALSDEALRLWSSYNFPGNVRELRNVVIRLTAKYPGQTIGHAELEAELDLLDDAMPPHTEPAPGEEHRNDTPVSDAINRLQDRQPFNLDQLLADTEHSYIEAALRLTNGNVSQAARLLGINRTTLYNRMESLAREP